MELFQLMQLCKGTPWDCYVGAVIVAHTPDEAMGLLQATVDTNDRTRAWHLSVHGLPVLDLEPGVKAPVKVGTWICRSIGTPSKRITEPCIISTERYSEYVDINKEAPWPFLISWSGTDE